MQGPAGASHSTDPHRPAATEMIPARTANTAICSGVFENRRAAAGGMMSIEMMSQNPDQFHGDGDDEGDQEHEDAFHGEGRYPFGARQLLVHRNGEKPTPNQGERTKRSRPSEVYPPQIQRADREDVPEEIAQQVHPDRLHQADGNDAHRERRCAPGCRAACRWIVFSGSAAS